MTQCSSIINVQRISELGTLSVTRNFLMLSAYIVPNALILSTLMMEAIRSSETSVLTRVARRQIVEDGIFIDTAVWKAQLLHSINRLGSVAEMQYVSCEVRNGFYIPEDANIVPSASFIGVTRIGELGTTLAVTSNRRTLRTLFLFHRFLAPWW
jgi:hypothetical protein